MTKKEAVIAFMKDTKEIVDRLYEENWADLEEVFDDLPSDEQENYGWKPETAKEE